MIYVDTHVVLWLYEGLLDRFTEQGKCLLEENNIMISPAVMLELEFLREIKRIKVSAKKIISELRHINLQVSNATFTDVVEQAMHLKWTRDPFDRLIVANAVSDRVRLLTKDRIIHKNCDFAVW